MRLPGLVASLPPVRVDFGRKLFLRLAAVNFLPPYSQFSSPHFVFLFLFLFLFLLEGKNSNCPRSTICEIVGKGYIYILGVQAFRE